jgi:acetyl esterase/lipase
MTSVMIEQRAVQLSSLRTVIAAASIRATLPFESSDSQGQDMSPSKVPVVALCLAVVGLAGHAYAQQTSSGPPPDIAAQIRALGPAVNVPAANKLYEPLLARQPTANVTRMNDIAFGPDERHKLDTYTPEQASSERHPAVIFFHGGGFIGGERQSAPTSDTSSPAMA